MLTKDKKGREIARLQSADATNQQLMATLRAQIMTLSAKSPDALNKALVDITTLNANVAQKDMEIQGLKAKETHTVSEYNKMKKTYETHVINMTAKYNELVRSRMTTTHGTI